MIEVVYRFDPAAPGPPPPPATAAEARARLEAGNRAFVDMIDPTQPDRPSRRIFPLDPTDLGFAAEPGTAPRQEPFAAILGCSDARVPTELLFSEACNSLFVVRVAGNVLGNECLGSLHYAQANLGAGLRLTAVLGHSGCGAVTAAVDAFLTPTKYLSLASSHALRAVVDRIFVTVQGAALSLEMVHGASVRRLPGYRAALIETSVALNAAHTAATLRLEFELAAGAAPDEGLEVVFGVYDLATRCVGVPGAEAAIGLERPPRSQELWIALGGRIVGSERIGSLLDGGAAHR